MVVSFVPGSENEYKLSDNPNDNHLVGVISENPSVILNSAKVGPPVAMTGRVKIKLKHLVQTYGEECISGGMVLQIRVK